MSHQYYVQFLFVLLMYMIIYVYIYTYMLSFMFTGNPNEQADSQFAMFLTFVRTMSITLT